MMLCRRLHVPKQTQHPKEFRTLLDQLLDEEDAIAEAKKAEKAPESPTSEWKRKMAEYMHK